MFGDDTTFQVSAFDIKQLFETANFELAKASNWFKANKITLNVKRKHGLIATTLSVLEALVFKVDENIHLWTSM